MKSNKNYKITFLFLIFLGLSPVGVIIPYILLSIFGICQGALGSGIDCTPSILEVYPGTVAQYFEVSMFFGVGIVWFLIAILVWLKAIKYGKMWILDYPDNLKV